MPRFVALYGLVPLMMSIGSISGCGPNNPEPAAEPVSKRILGHWEGEEESDEAVFEDWVRSQNFTDDEIARVRKVRAEMREGRKQYVSFQDDGTCISGVGRNNVFVGFHLTWEVVSESEHQTRKEKKNDGTTWEIMDITFQDDDHFTATMIPKENRPIALRIHYKRIEQIPKEVVDAAENDVWPIPDKVNRD